MSGSRTGEPARGSAGGYIHDALLRSARLLMMELPYSAQQMYDLVADVASYPKFLPWNSAARIRSRRVSWAKSRVMALPVKLARAARVLSAPSRSRTS